MRFRLTSLFVAAAMLNALAQEGLASVSVASASGCAPDTGTYFASVSCEIDPEPSRFHVSGSASAFAGFGSVNAKALAIAPTFPGFHSVLEVRAHAASIYTDIFVSAPPDTNETSILTTVNFHVSGGVSSIAPHAIADASATVRMSVEDFSRIGFIRSVTVGGVTTSTGTNFFEGQDGGGGYDVPVGAFVNVGENTVSVDLAVNTFVDQNGVTPGGQIAAIANANFSNTVSFARNRPVFDLPEGWTVNSVSANIVNNYWVPPVPEPSSALLALIAAAGWSAVAIRRKSRNE